MKAFLFAAFVLLQISHQVLGQNAQACSAGCNRFAIPRCQRYIGTLGFFCAADTAATAAYIAQLDDRAAATNDSWTNWKSPSSVTNIYSATTGGAAPTFLLDVNNVATGFLGGNTAGAFTTATADTISALVTFSSQPNYPPWAWIRSNELLTLYTTTNYALAGTEIPGQSVYHRNTFWFPASYSSYMTYTGPFNLNYPSTQCLQMYQGLVCADTFNGATVPGTLNSLDVCSPVDNFIKPAMCFTSCKSFLTICGFDLFKYTTPDGKTVTNIAYNGNAAGVCNDLVKTGVVAANGFTQCYSLNASALAVRVSYIAGLLSCIVSLAFFLL
eukprot:CAMPEP_0196661892 /NCGR_PEP_ID=MMETSP1086-20130531/46296_1 /TAXON_ID=77921 /ORGANISM="Cyanoptyche  gloeocystis , Strain SAG4.97" /LENGTH=327 /DNA_ID=CAMNT_0041997005 /DNA_START=64 /DNA_END=1047 /DNA_ORIENTATION=-